MQSNRIDCPLSPRQIEALARPFIYMEDIVTEFYRDPKNEAAFQAWHLKKYGCKAPEIG